MTTEESQLEGIREQLKLWADGPRPSVPALQMSHVQRDGERAFFGFSCEEHPEGEISLEKGKPPEIHFTHWELERVHVCWLAKLVWLVGRAIGQEPAVLATESLSRKVSTRVRFL